MEGGVGGGFGVEGGVGGGVGGGFRRAPEMRKPRWAKLQMTSEAPPKRENLAGQSSKSSSEAPPKRESFAGQNSKTASSAPPKRENLVGQTSKWLPKLPRNAKTSLGKSPNHFRGAPWWPPRASYQFSIELPSTRVCAGSPTGPRWPRGGTNGNASLGHSYGSAQGFTTGTLRPNKPGWFPLGPAEGP